MGPRFNVTLRGDETRAAGLVSFARQKAIALARTALVSKRFIVSDSIISIEFTRDRKLCNIDIEAANLGFNGYQFIYSGGYQRMETMGGIQQWLGSAVFLSLPEITAAEPVPDWSKVRARATGSLIEPLPGGKTSKDKMQWIPYVDNLTQVNLIPEPVYCRWDDITQPPTMRLVNAWLGSIGEIYNFGAFMFMSAQVSDVGYDIAPTRLTETKKPLGRMPDTDWPDNACILKVQSEFGTKTFIVMVDGHSEFHCWQHSYESKDDVFPPGSPYLVQAIKANVPASQVKSATPPFPGWAHTFPNGWMRRDNAYSEETDQPRYVWRFHPFENRVVGHLLERTAWNADVYATTPAGGIPYKEAVIGPLRLKTDHLWDGSVPYHATEIDYPGWAEFSFEITVTGPEREDFDFSMTLTQDRKTQAEYYPIGAAYLSPCPGGWGSRGIAASPGDLITARLEVYRDQGVADMIRKGGAEVDFPISSATSQAFIVIAKESTGDELFRFCTSDFPETYAKKEHNYADFATYAFEGFLTRMELETLSFGYQGILTSRRHDTASYITLKGDTNLDVKHHQVWHQMDLGARFYVFGKKVHEERVGSDNGVFEKMDSVVRPDSTRLATDKEETCRLHNNFVPYWGDKGLVSIFAARMGYYMPNPSDPDPTYDASVPCAEWTDWSGTTRTTTISFKNEIAVEVLDELGGWSGLGQSHRGWNAQYWNTFVVPEAWKIYNTFEAMRTAGDTFDTNRRGKEGYSHASHVYHSHRNMGYDQSWETYSNIKINHRVYDFKTGAFTYGVMWSKGFVNRGTFELIVSHDGYYAIGSRLKYFTGEMPRYTLHRASISGKHAGRLEQINRFHYSPLDAKYTQVNKMDTGQFAMKEIDIIGHISSETTLTHREQYEIAYQKSEPDFPLPQFRIDWSTERYTYWWREIFMFDGSYFYEDNGFFNYGLSFKLPRANGSGQFV